MPKFCWALLAACLWAGGGAAIGSTNTHFAIDVWDSEKGLPGNSVIALTQTRDGYLWLGTLYGLARFDGIRFTTFNEANTPDLNSSRIVKLFEDSRGALWIGTDVGGIFVVKDGHVTSVEVGLGTREGRLVSLCEDPTGAVWLYTADATLGRWADGKVDSWEVRLSNPENRGKGRALTADASGRLWFDWFGRDRSGTNSWWLYSLRPGAVRPTGDVQADAYDKQPVPNLDYLLGSRDGGLWRFANGRIQKLSAMGQAIDLDWAYPWNPFATPVNAACEDPQGNLVVGTGGEGIFWFDAQGHSTQLTSPVLPHTTVLSLCFDREGDLWLGTDGGGLCRVKPQVFEVQDGTQGNIVQSVCDDHHGGIWIGYYGDRIDHWHEGVLEHFRGLQGLTNLGVKSVFVDTDQNVWAGTYLGGLRWLQQGQFVRAPGSHLLAPEREISVLYQDHSGKLWAGSQAGLAQRTTTGWQLASEPLPPLPTRALVEDKEGDLWIGTQGAGLVRVRQGQATWFGKTNGLPSDNITCLYLDGDGVLWAGTSSGLARYQAGKWASYAGRLGEGTSIGYLLEDDQGDVWLGSNAGLLRVKKRDLNELAYSTQPVPVRSFGIADGLPTRECSQGSQPAACRTADGKLWFPTIKGLVSLTPARLTSNTNPPPVIIESVLVDGRPQGSDTLRALAPQAVTVPADKESLEIHYTSLSLSAPDKGGFKYRLENYEKDWTFAEPLQRYARYSKLPHGHYRFQVQACNEDGFWNQTGASLAITVLPPFWQTWWFLTGTSLALLAAVVGSVHYVSTQKLQRQVASLRQQEALEKERARIARDLHDQLGANLTQVALLGEMAESDKALPGEVESHARQISQTARETTRALDEIVWTVNPSNDSLDGLVNYICKYAQEYLALAGLSYRLDVPAQLPAVPISPELRHNVFLTSKEAVNNIVKHARASSTWLRLQLQPGQFVLEIEDDGRGMSDADSKKGRSGLRNMRKRMEDLGGQFELAPRPGGGTRVRLTVPIGTAQT